MIITTVFVAASYPFLLAWGVALPIFSSAWGNTSHFQNELKETMVRPHQSAPVRTSCCSAEWC